jgi:hypothetical protein
VDGGEADGRAVEVHQAGDEEGDAGFWGGHGGDVTRGAGWRLLGWGGLDGRSERTADAGHSRSRRLVFQVQVSVGDFGSV